MKTVLLIEDDAKLSLAYGVRLKAIGYTVHVARDAVAAIGYARKTNPDVILLDISLPGGDGFLVAERLSNMISSAATPIVFITASKRADLRERAMKLGAAGFLEKPFDATTLADAIESALSPDQNWAPTKALLTNP
jgi:DNA-binding response OmpR family regulator